MFKIDPLIGVYLCVTAIFIFLGIVGVLLGLYGGPIHAHTAGALVFSLGVWIVVCIVVAFLGLLGRLIGA